MSEFESKPTPAQPAQKDKASAFGTAAKGGGGFLPGMTVAGANEQPTAFNRPTGGFVAAGLSSLMGGLFGGYADGDGAKALDAPKPGAADHVVGNKKDPDPASAKAGQDKGTAPGAPPTHKSDPKADKKAADKALKDVEKLLDPAQKHADAGKDATAAMHALTSLTPDQQMLAMRKMSKDDFQHLITAVPKENREQFETLFKHTSDPERKLLLWAEYHKSKVGNDTKAKHEDVPLIDQAINAITGIKTKEMQEVERRNSERSDIGKTTEKEVDEETARLMAKIKAGKKVSLTEIDKLAERKDLEHQIEFKHLVNITNDVDNAGTPTTGATKPTEYASWSKGELEQIASGLDRLPKEATTDNPMLKEIRRSKMRRDFDSKAGKWVDDKDVGGDHGDGVITIYDTGVTGSYRHTGQTSELGDHHKGKKTPHGPVSPLEETIVHEVGHDIHDLHPEAMDKLKKTTGWSDVANSAALKTQLKAAGLSDAAADAKIKELEGQRANNYGQEGITVNGTTYKVDPYSNGGFLSHKEKAIPKGAEWDYARTNYKDHFAEMYASAVHTPEALHRDLVEAPGKNLAAKEKEEQKLTEKLKALQASGKADPKKVAKLEDDIKAAKADVTQAKEVQKMYEDQWKIMREDVFHMSDAKVDEGAKALEGHVPAGKEKQAAKLQAEFKAKADKVVTPQQLEELEKQYAAKMEKL